MSEHVHNEYNVSLNVFGLIYIDKGNACINVNDNRDTEIVISHNEAIEALEECIDVINSWRE